MRCWFIYWTRARCGTCHSHFKCDVKQIKLAARHRVSELTGPVCKTLRESLRSLSGGPAPGRSRTPYCSLYILIYMRTVLRAGKPSDFYCTVRNTLLMMYSGALCKAFTNTKISNQGKLYTLDLYPSTANAHETHTFVIIIIIIIMIDLMSTLSKWKLHARSLKCDINYKDEMFCETSRATLLKGPSLCQISFHLTLFSFLLFIL